LALLAPEAQGGKLTPAGWRQYALAALANGEPRRAREALVPLQKSAALGTRGYAALEAQVLVALVLACDDGVQLNSLWSSLPKPQRRIPAVVDAYARRAAGFGLALAAMDEVESALRREWSSSLIITYGLLDGDDLDGRLRRAEAWLDAHPNDAELLLTLGRMCVRLTLWGKAHRYLDRSIALKSSVDAWEALADTWAGEGQLDQAQRCYQHALLLARGEWQAVAPVVKPGVRLDTRPVAIEERDEHGMPRLP